MRFKHFLLTLMSFMLILSCNAQSCPEKTPEQQTDKKFFDGCSEVEYKSKTGNRITYVMLVCNPQGYMATRTVLYTK